MRPGMEKKVYDVVECQHFIVEAFPHTSGFNSAHEGANGRPVLDTHLNS